MRLSSGYIVHVLQPGAVMVQPLLALQTFPVPGQIAALLQASSPHVTLHAHEFWQLTLPGQAFSGPHLTVQGPVPQVMSFLHALDSVQLTVH